MTRREELLIDSFVTLADTMIRDFDVVEFLSLLADRTVEIFTADASGIVLADGQGRLELVASSSHQMELLELLELQDDEGPCPEAFVSGASVECLDLADAVDRWPSFAPAAVAQGFRSVHALPLRLRDEVIGALNLMSADVGSLSPEDLAAAQALADVAAIGLLQQRAARESALIVDQLQHALTSRIVIEQAKGVIAETLDLGMDEAFERLRGYARDRNAQLSDVAAAIAERRFDARELGGLRPPTR